MSSILAAGMCIAKVRVRFVGVDERGRVAELAGREDGGVGGGVDEGLGEGEAGAAEVGLHLHVVIHDDTRTHIHISSGTI